MYLVYRYEVFQLLILKTNVFVKLEVCSKLWDKLIIAHISWIRNDFTLLLLKVFRKTHMKIALNNE